MIELAQLNLDEVTDRFYSTVLKFCKQHRKEAFEPDEVIVFSYTYDEYKDSSTVGERLQTLQMILNEVDISNFFVRLKTTNTDVESEIKQLSSIDPVPLNTVVIDGAYDRKPDSGKNTRPQMHYDYNSWEPVKISPDELTEQETALLRDSETFCIYPWIHMHTYPTGETYPCCHASMSLPVGTTKQNSLNELANSDNMKSLRLDLINGVKRPECKGCYEHEQSGFFSGRKSANKHHGHHIKRVAETEADGSYNNFTMTYWDVRFSNLCNLKCRSCGHIFSSQWYKDQIALAGPEYKENNPQLTYAGKFETDMLEQVLEHIDYVEQIYFAGGEPLVMEEHYKILETLIERGRTDVRLIYNSNFTKLNLKDKHVFEYWKHFPQVAVGASLDAMGKHAEYIRTGTKWATVERNRREMIEQVPHVDFYISCTLSIMNSLHVTDFHRSWVDKGLIKAKDFNINMLLNPEHYRIDIATPEFKATIRERYQRHLEWLKPLDDLNRASTGYESALNMLNNDNTQYLEQFWEKTEQLDQIRSENVFDYLPELKALQ